MDPVTLGVVGVGALILRSLGKGAGETPSPAPVDPSYDTAVEQSTPINVGIDAAATVDKLFHSENKDAARVLTMVNNTIVSTVPVAAGIVSAVQGSTNVVGSVAISGAIGALITNDAWGSTGAWVSLALNPTGGMLSTQAGNIGRVIARELDKMLGGDGKTGTGIVYQSVGFAGGLVIGIAGIAALPIVGGVFLLVVAIGSLFSDTSRLAYGQNGITGDSVRDARLFRSTAIPHLLKSRADEKYGKNIANIPPLEIEYLQEMATHMALGWISELNRSRQALFMSRPWGIGQTYDSTYEWGAQRGVFMRPTSLSDVKTLLINDTPRKIDSESQQLMYSLGRFVANFGSYMAARNEERGVFVSMQTHLQYWKDHGAFECEEVWAADGGDAIRVIDPFGNNIWISWEQSPSGTIKLIAYPA